MARRPVPGVRRRPAPGHLLVSRPWSRAVLLAFGQPGAAVAVLVATAVLGVAAATAPLFLSTAATGALHRTVSSCPELYRPGVTNADPDVGDAPLPEPAAAYAGREDGRVRAVLAERHVPVAERTLVLGRPGGAAPVILGRDEAVTLFSAPSALGRVEQVRGRAGAPGLWLPEELAARLHAGPGDQLRLRGRTVPVAGTYRGLDDPSYAGILPVAWCRWSSLVLPRIGDAGPAQVHPLVLTDPGTLLAAAGTDRPWVTWSAALDPAAARASDAAATAAALRGAGDEVRFSTGIVGGYTDQVSIGSATARAEQVRGALSDATWPAALAAVLVALLLAAAAGGYWTERRAGEVRLLVARGVGPVGLAGKAVLEMLLPALSGAALGWAATLLIAPRLGPSDLLDPGAAGRALRTVAVALAVGLLALGTVAAVRGRSTGERTIGAARSRWALVPYELVLVAAAGWAHRRLAGRGAVLGGDQVVRVDPLVVAFPLLLLAGLTVLAVRLAGLPAARLGRVGGPVAVFLAARRLAAGRAVAAAVLVAVALPVGVLVTCASLTDSVADTVHTKARTYVGADVVLRTDAKPGATPPTGGAGTVVSQLPEGLSDRSTPLPVLGVDPATLARWAYWRPGAGSEPLPDLLARLGPATGGTVPALLAGRSGPVHESYLRGTRLPVRIVGRVPAFPGMRASSTPVLVVDRRALAGVDPFAARTEEVWTDAAGAGTAAAAVGAGGLRVTDRLDADEILRNTALYPLTWTFGYVQALATLAGAMAAAALLLYLAARQRARTTAYVLSRRMGLSRRRHLGSLLAELTVAVGLGALLGGLLARLVLIPVVGLLELQPDRPPHGTELVLSGPAVLGVVAAVALLVPGAALVAQLVADRARPADVLRGG